MESSIQPINIELSYFGLREEYICANFSAQISESTYNELSNAK
jgi:hypothetical protein